MNPIVTVYELVKGHLLDKPWKQKVAAVLGVLAAFTVVFALGRFSKTPEVRVETKIEYQDKIVEKVVERIQVVKVKDTKRQTMRDVKIVRAKDGSEVITMHTDSAVDSTTKTDTNATKTDDKTETKQEKVTQVVKPGANWMVGVMGGYNWHRFTVSGLPWEKDALVGGLEVDRRVIGPVWGGAWVHTTGDFGLTLKLELQ